MSHFELEWLGGPAESRFRRRRPGIERLPWGALAAAKLEGESLEAARRSWTEGAFTEYVSAAAFSALTTALLEAGAPVDLIAMAADCVVDEMTHTELAARMCGELGGAAPLPCDFAKVAPGTDPALPAIERAAEVALLTSCIGEALSVPTITGSRAAAKNPLSRAVLSRLLRDEPAHAKIGGLVLDWAGDRVDKTRLGAVGTRRLAAYARLWDPNDEGPTPLGAIVGWMPGEALARALRHTVTHDIVEPLARRGIAIAHA